MHTRLCKATTWRCARGSQQDPDRGPPLLLGGQGCDGNGANECLRGDALTFPGSCRPRRSTSSRTAWRPLYSRSHGTGGGGQSSGAMKLCSALRSSHEPGSVSQWLLSYRGRYAPPLQAHQAAAQLRISEQHAPRWSHGELLLSTGSTKNNRQVRG